MSLETTRMVSIIVGSIFILMTLLIGYMLYTLAKQEDERRTLIKTKAMSGTLTAVVGGLIIQIIISIIMNQQLEGLNPLISLTLISIAFFFLLVIYKRRYGG